jgi:hypothetical protein
MTTPRLTAPNSDAAPKGRERFGLSSTSRPQRTGFGVLGAVAGLVLIILAVGGIVWTAATGKAPPSQRPRIFGGSLVLDDYRPLTVIDLATGQVTVQLEGIYAQVGAMNYGDVEAVSTSAGTTLVNRHTGTFNMLGKDNYVLGPPSNGISLGPLPGEVGAAGFADGASTYILRYGPKSTISLVDSATALAGAQALASRSGHPVRPLGFIELPNRVTGQAGGVTVNGGNLWLLASAANGTNNGKCQLVELTPTPQQHQGLSASRHATVPAPCADAALESSDGTLALASPGRVELFEGDPVVKNIQIPGTAHASAFLPVQGAAGEIWFLARLPSGWSVFGVSPGGQLSAPSPLRVFGPGAAPVIPGYSGGELYTLDQAQPGQPTLWAINPETGAMSPVHGAAHYPAKSVTEKANFHGAEVLVDGPRVIFNNPESLLAVVVFTDGSHAPVIVDKSNAVVVSAVGPGDVNVHVKPSKPTKRPSQQPTVTVPTTVPITVAPPITQPVTQQAGCAASTEKPYTPEVTYVSAADESVLVEWSYHLLSEQDCLPRTWSVTVTALGGPAQPAHPTQVVNGQQELLFSGLRPGTSYQVVVTAYIGPQSTSSTPANFVTTANGPGAPAQATTATDGHGAWVVSWAPCTGPKCNVPASSWNVIGTSCTTGFVGQAPEVSVSGSRRSVVVNSGNDLGLLGDSLTFSVQGVGNTGLTGAPTSDHACTQAWQPPNAAALDLLAAGTATGQTITADLQLLTSGNQTLAYGGDSVSFTYSVGSHTVGPTRATQVRIAGLSPAQSYGPRVVVTPLGHPSAAVTVTGRPFSKTVPWPAGLHIAASGVVGADANTGRVVATFPGLPAGLFKAGGEITCGSEILPLSEAVASGQVSTILDLDQMGGTCSVSIRLESTVVPDPFGVPSPLLSAPFTIGAPQAYNFTVTAVRACAGNCSKLVLHVKYDGKGEPAGTDWRVSATVAGKKECSATTAPTGTSEFPATLTWPGGCPTPTVVVSWVYLGEPASTSATSPVLPSLSTPTTHPKTVRTVTTTTTLCSSARAHPGPCTTSTTASLTTSPSTTAKPNSTVVTTSTTAPARTTTSAVTPTTSPPTTRATPTSARTPTTAAPTTATPTTAAPTTVTPTTAAPTTTTPTSAPPTSTPTTAVPTTSPPTTLPPTTLPPITSPSTTVPPTTAPPTTAPPTTVPPTTAPTTTVAPTTSTTPTTTPTSGTTPTSVTVPTTISTTTTTLPTVTTTTTTPTTSSTTTSTVPVTTTTVPETTTTAPLTTTSGASGSSTSAPGGNPHGNNSSSGSSSAACTPSQPGCLSAVALAGGSRSSPPKGPRAKPSSPSNPAAKAQPSASATAMWAALGGIAGTTLAGSLAWGLRRRPKGRYGTYKVTEVTT